MWNGLYTRISFYLFEREREGGREGERERERERERDQLPPIHAPNGDQTSNLGMCPNGDKTCGLLVCGTMFQPTEPPSQGPVGPDLM